MVDPIPAGSRLLDEDLSPWRTAINAALVGTAKVKTTDTTRASTTTYADDPHLSSIPVAASAVYIVEMHGVYQAGATPQIKFQMTFPVGATMEAGSWEYDPGTDDWAPTTVLSQSSPAAFVAGLLGTGANVPFRLTGSLHMGSTAGNLALQWAQNVSNATASALRKGSWMRTTRVG
ncbi:MAG: hypothetical protein V4515_14700 [Chloroflexota bacterium]